jgi:hypothetical protein
MHPQLEAVVGELEAARARLHRLADQLPDARWKSRPAPDRWSAAECVGHLNMTSRAYIPLLRRALEAAPKRSVTTGRYRRDFLGWLFSTLVGPTPKIGKGRIFRVKTTSEFSPAATGPRVDVVGEFDRLQDDLVTLTREADGLPLEEMMIVSPFGGKIRYNYYAALRILPRHQQRHLVQAEDAIAAST